MLMNLTDAQKQKVSEWLDQGLKVADVQKKMSAELGVSMTYMEVRFLLDDLRLKPKDPEPPKQPAPSSPIASATGTAPAAQAAAPAGAVPGATLPEGAPAGGGAVQLSVDALARPGTVVSGKVTFSDGQKAEWYLDQMGRPGLVPAQKGYRPSQLDIMEFQDLLQLELQKLGF
jgi:hypothetical protein